LVKYPKSGYEKYSEALHFYVKDIRILTPKEYEALKAAIPKDQHKTILDILLITGMRYAELLRLYDNPAWYNEKRNRIHLLEEAQRKHKRRQLERTIHPLSSMFHYLLNDSGRPVNPLLEST
jgi:integrase